MREKEKAREREKAREKEKARATAHSATCRSTASTTTARVTDVPQLSDAAVILRVDGVRRWHRRGHLRVVDNASREPLVRRPPLVQLRAGFGSTLRNGPRDPRKPDKLAR